MGTKRVDKKPKRKSVKAKVTSKFSAKRKLSRMGKKVKKGMMGPSTEFVTRSAVLKKLQITLKDFRRLCILKGIYPRVPEKAPKGSDKVYYDIKDISYLSHEPLLLKFREFKAFMKKIRKASGRRQYDEAQRKDRIKPSLNMDHLVRERYPRFIDALRDLDDPLCMIHLFASLPSIGRVTSDKTNKCQELSQHFQYIVMKSKSLRKVFVSVKGLYFQVEFMGEFITWIVPHAFTQIVPKEVDLRVMITFLDFYEILIKFVLFKLYNTEGLSYPPVYDKNLRDNGCSLLSIKTSPLESNQDNNIKMNTTIPNTIQDANTNPIKPNVSKKISQQELRSLDQKIKTISNDSTGYNECDDEDDDDDYDPEKLIGPLSDVFANLHGHQKETKDGHAEEEKNVFHMNEIDKNQTNLFGKLKFFINREVPLNWMQFCIVSFGGIIGWEGELSPYSIEDPGITHHIVDRPVQNQIYSTREYIQPQWIFDSINMKMILPTQHYKPGSKLPPHLSPFVDDDKEGYLPKYKEEIQKLKKQANNDGSSDVISSELVQQNDVSKHSNDNDDNDDEEEEEEEDMNEQVPYNEVKSSYATVKGPKAIVYEPKIVAVTEVRLIITISAISILVYIQSVYVYIY